MSRITDAERTTDSADAETMSQGKGKLLVFEKSCAGLVRYLNVYRDCSPPTAYLVNVVFLDVIAAPLASSASLTAGAVRAMLEVACQTYVTPFLVSVCARTMWKDCNVIDAKW